MAERRREGRVRKNIELPTSHADLLKQLAKKHGLTEAAAVCVAITQWADREGITAPSEKSS
jgi:hypothetical protein